MALLKDIERAVDTGQLMGGELLKPHISALIKYFKIELPKLKESYQWVIPKIEGFSQSRESGYEANVQLKTFFNKKWAASTSDEERIKLSKIIVVDFGGVKGNKPETLQRYVREIAKNEPSTPLAGVASYSKIFAMVDGEKYAIYDARVAACLNAVQYSSNIDKGIAFNYVQGRNNITGNQLKKIGFACQDQFKPDNLVKNGWARVQKNDTYSDYLKTLKECLIHLSGYKLHDLEMALFANAEIECEKAMENWSLRVI